MTPWDRILSLIGQGQEERPLIGQISGSGFDSGCHEMRKLVWNYLLQRI